MFTVLSILVAVSNSRHEYVVIGDTLLVRALESESVIPSGGIPVRDGTQLRVGCRAYQD